MNDKGQANRVGTFEATICSGSTREDDYLAFNVFPTLRADSHPPTQRKRQWGDHNLALSFYT